MPHPAAGAGSTAPTEAARRWRSPWEEKVKGFPQGTVIELFDGDDAAGAGADLLHVGAHHALSHTDLRRQPPRLGGLSPEAGLDLRSADDQARPQIKGRGCLAPLPAL